MGKVKFKKSKIDRMLTVFAWLSLFIAIIFSVTAILATFSGADNGKVIFGHKLLIVESDSMSKSDISKDEPIFFNVDDLIIIQEVSDYSTIKVGDVITFVSYNDGSRGKTLSHKVRSIKTTSSGLLIGFETYGINTGVSDQAIVEPSTIIGKYVNKVPEVGRLFKFFKTPGGFFLSISVPCLLLVIFFSIKVGKQLGKKQLSDSYDNQIESLKERLLNLENIPEGEDMQDNLQQTNVLEQSVEKQEDVETKQTDACTPVPQSMEQLLLKSLETIFGLSLSSFSKTNEALMRTIETLASNATKHVDALAHTIEMLTGGLKQPVVEEQPVNMELPKEPVETASPFTAVEEETPVSLIEEQAIVEEEPVIEEAVVTEEAPQEVLDAEIVKLNNLKQRVKVPFNKKLLSLNSEIKEFFSEVHNELISYKKLNYRVSFKGITYHVGRKNVAKMVVRGRTLKLHLALDVNDYPKTVYFQESLANVKAYQDVPFTVKIKSKRGKNNAIKLIVSLAEKNGYVKKEGETKENILKQLKLFK